MQQQQQQQQPSVITPDANSCQPATVIFVPQGRVQPEKPKELPLKSFHFYFGIVQIVVGVLLFIIEVAALGARVILATGPGIYCGVFIFVPGLLSMLAAKFNSRGLIIASMVMDIIGSCVCVIGIGFTSFEIAYQHDRVQYYSTNRYYHYMYNFSLSRINFGLGKSIFVLIFCFLEFIAMIIHASLSCRSFCSCCLPSTRQYTNTNGGVMVQGQSTQQGITYVNPTQQQQQGTAYMSQGVVFVPQGVAHGAQQQPTAVYYLCQQPQIQMQPLQPLLPQMQPQGAACGESRQNDELPSYNDVSEVKLQPM